MALLAPQSSPLLRASHLSLQRKVTQKGSAPLAVVSGGHSTSSRVSHCLELTVAHPHGLCCPQALLRDGMAGASPSSLLWQGLCPHFGAPWCCSGLDGAVERLLFCPSPGVCCILLLGQGSIGVWSGLRGLALSWQSHLFGDITSNAHRVKSLLWEKYLSLFCTLFYGLNRAALSPSLCNP